jgi:Methylase involved in ubiquinone/menaquinone biosynthesis
VGREVRTVGVDFSRGQLRGAVDIAPPAAVVQGDMAALPFSAGGFDAVTAYHSLIHILAAEQQAVIDEFARVLRPGGRVLVTAGTVDWRGTNPDWLDTGVEMQWQIAGAGATRGQLAAAGFTITDNWTGTVNLDGNEEWVFLAGRLDG